MKTSLLGRRGGERNPGSPWGGGFLSLLLTSPATAEVVLASQKGREHASPSPPKYKSPSRSADELIPEPGQPQQPHTYTLRRTTFLILKKIPGKIEILKGRDLPSHISLSVALRGFPYRL